MKIFQKKKKDEFIQVIKSNLSARLDREFLSRLDDKEREELKDILDSDGDAWAFIENNVPNVQNIMNKTVKDFKKETKKLEKKIRNKVANKG